MVTAAPFDLSILILTEDSAEGSFDSLSVLAKKMLVLVDSASRTNRIEFEPQRDAARAAMRGNLWKSKSPFDRPKIIALGRAIAAKLLEQGAPGFVLFHVDGDRAWAERASSENVEKFDAFVRAYVEPSVDHALREQRKRDPDIDIERSKSEAMTRFLRLTPFYSIEAWLYQNTKEAARLCAARCRRHIEQIERWEADRGALDEVCQPKESLRCLASPDYPSLAGPGFPSAAVFKADKSYAAAVMALLECADLCAALARTYA